MLFRVFLDFFDCMSVYADAYRITSTQHERRVNFELKPSKLQRLTFQTFRKIFDFLILRNHTTIP